MSSLKEKSIAQLQLQLAVAQLGTLAAALLLTRAWAKQKLLRHQWPKLVCLWGEQPLVALCSDVAWVSSCRLQQSGVHC